MYSGGTGRPYLVEGVGEDFWPTTYDPSLVDRTVMVTDAESFAAARRVTREEGLLIGGSCGTAVHAALVVGRELGPDAVVVVLLPDSGRGYLSKIFDDDWMIGLRVPPLRGHRCAATCSRPRTTRSPTSCSSRPTRRARDAWSLHARARRVAGRGGVSKEPPLAAKEVSRDARRAVAHGPGVPRPVVLDRPVVEMMSPAPPDDRHRRAGARRRRAARALHARCWCSTAATRWACSASPDVLTFLAARAPR